MENKEIINNELLALANQVTKTFTSENETKSKSEEEIIDDNHDSDFKPPEVDWINLEAKLKEAQQEINIQNKRANFNSDRDEIRRKLAVFNSSASSFNNHHHPHNNENIISDYLRKQTKTNYLGQNLQICFMNESGDDAVDDSETLSTQSDEINNDDISCTSTTNTKSSHQISCSFSAFSFDPNETCETFITQHLNLQNKTKLALKQVPIDVRKEIENEKNVIKQPSPIADIVGLQTYGVKRLEREHIVDMNIGQLQVIANDLCNQIEKTNEILKDMLIDRDDLYMQQDALLVDIEDITKRIQEYAGNFQKNTNSTKETSLNSFSESIIEKQPNKLTNTKNKFFQFGQLTNKLFRFNKKT